MIIFRLLASALVLTGIGAMAQGFYLPAKAALAQVLLQRAWAASDEGPVRPWPWAETWPVGRLEAPSLDLDRIILAGSEGAALAFAPGHVDGTSTPGEGGNVVITGHRDTVFSFLGDLGIGSVLVLEGSDRRPRHYVIESTMVVHEEDTSVLLPTEHPSLTLITCYPLDARAPGGPLRYVVRATAATQG